MGEENKVTVQYKTQEVFCHCCSQILENPKTSQQREFDFSKGDFLEWLSQEDWKTEARYDDEFHEIIKEFIYETIRFFATSSDTKIIIDKSEIEKAKKFALDEIIA